MSALAVEPDAPHGQGWDELVRIWEGTDAPEGCKVEIIEGIITVSPGPSKDHNHTAELLQSSLYPVIPDGCGIYQTLGIAVPAGSGLYIPDLVVIPRRLVLGSDNLAQGDEALMVVEVTSRWNANHDRIAKVRGYAKAAVPLYLLLDPWHSGRPTATLYGEPEGGTYRVLASVQYGDKLTLPEPFGVDIDTGDFPVS
ncbi:Uma2 family endonuclease [Streptomyces sp. SID3212]|uniref:Uma2 family endonuclease n=1 Tax=unclassified Streptomyces TaxID=2593676 RepID=UPI00136B2605|nr:Uma2 family endonuclease [Streptomyces sp. SID3212]MYV55047.1 Uma2 family endonuclease [Streptomyces sp. SID3212]